MSAIDNVDGDNLGILLWVTTVFGAVVFRTPGGWIPVLVLAMLEVLYT